MLSLRESIAFVATKTCLLLRRKFRRDKHVVAAKIFSRDKHNFVAASILLSRHFSIFRQTIFRTLLISFLEEFGPYLCMMNKEVSITFTPFGNSLVILKSITCFKNISLIAVNKQTNNNNNNNKKKERKGFTTVQSVVTIYFWHFRQVKMQL